MSEFDQLNTECLTEYELGVFTYCKNIYRQFSRCVNLREHGDIVTYYTRELCERLNHLKSLLRSNPTQTRMEIYSSINRMLQRIISAKSLYDFIERNRINNY